MTHAQIRSMTREQSVQHVNTPVTKTAAVDPAPWLTYFEEVFTCTNKVKK